MPLTDIQREAVRSEVQRWLPKPAVEWTHTAGRVYDSAEDSACALRVVSDEPQGLPDFVETFVGPPTNAVMQLPQQRCRLTVELSLLSTLPDQTADAYAKLHRALLGLYSDVSRLALNAANVGVVRRGMVVTSEETEDQGIVVWETKAPITLSVVYTLAPETALLAGQIAAADPLDFATPPTP